MDWAGGNWKTTEYRCAAGQQVLPKGASNDEVLSFAYKEERILFTSNARDFKPLATEWFLMERDHAGIVIVPGQTDRALLSRARRSLASGQPPEGFNNTYRFVQELLD